MKVVFTVLWISIINFLLVGQQRFDVKFPIDGKVRESIIVKPSKVAPSGGYPVVFMLHGTSGDGEKFYNISGWKELGEEENFITVFPSSLSWCYVEDGVEKNFTRWVNGNLTESPCPGPPQNYVDDVHFLKVLAKAIQDTFNTNTSKFYICGFSNGCSMIHKMAIEAGDIFAAAAGTSSILAQTDSATPLRRIPIWTMVGTLDDRFLTPPFTELPYGGDSILNYLKVPINRVLGAQGLTQTFDKLTTTYMHTYQFFENQPGQNSKPYIFSLVKDMMHEFPNGINHPVDGPRFFWNFFKQASTLGIKDQFTNQQQSDINLFPNPILDQATIQITNSTEPYRWELMDGFGKMIQNGYQKFGEAFVLSHSGIPSGIYLLRVRTDNSFKVKKIIFE